MTLGERITLEELERDPYPIYARLREEEPVAWVPAVRLWLVTRYDDVRTVDVSPEVFTAATEPSTLNRTMGVNMLGSEGPDQQRIRRVVEPPFRPREVEERTIRWPEMLEADELFSVGNYAKVVPMSQIESRPLQPGPLFRKARELYWAYAHDGG